MNPSPPWMQRLQMHHPIIQAPMAGTATPALAAAVSEAGGLGSLGIGASSLEQAQQLLQDVRALTPRAININLFCHRPPLTDATREAAWLQYLASHQRHCAAPMSPPWAMRRCKPCCWSCVRPWSAFTSACPSSFSSTRSKRQAYSPWPRPPSWKRRSRLPRPVWT